MIKHNRKGSCDEKNMILVRKLDLSHLCFSLNFYFSMSLLQFPSMFSFTNLFTIILFLICRLPETLKMKEKQDLILLILETSLNIILRLRNLSRSPNRPLDPMVDQY